MTKEQAKDLAARIRLQLSWHTITVQESRDTRIAPHNWFIAIQRKENDEQMLLIHSLEEWEQAVLAWDILRD